MIPWETFRSTEHSTPDIRIPLTDENVNCYLPCGDSQLDRGLNSPMLELAHERQFAISQLGNLRFDFNVQHPLRINDTLQRLSDFFMRHPTNDDQCSSPPCTDQLFDLRIVDPPDLDFPCFEISSDEAPIPEPSATLSISHPGRSPESMLDVRPIIQNQVNVEPDEEAEGSYGVEGDLFIRSKLLRAASRQQPVPLAYLRIHKRPRLRLSSPKFPRIRSDTNQLGPQHTQAQPQLSKRDNILQPDFMVEDHICMLT